MKTLKLKWILCCFCSVFYSTSIAQTTNQSADPISKESLTTSNYSSWVKKQTVTKRWVDDTYTEVLKPLSLISKQGWFGFYYATEANKVVGYDSNRTHGFNFQWTHGNILKNQFWAFYPGLDYGMQFSKLSDQIDLLLSNSPADIGTSQLHAQSTDLLLRGHLEYAKANFVPYVTAFGGSRIYTSGQSLLLKDFETDKEGNITDESTNINLNHNTVLVGGFGIGIRTLIKNRVSFDARYEAIFNQKTDIVDMPTSYLSGTNYTLRYRNTSPFSHQLKFGFMVNLSAQETEKVLYKKGYWQEEKDLQYFNSESDNAPINSINCYCDGEQPLNWTNSNTTTTSSQTKYTNTIKKPYRNDMSDKWLGLHYTQEGWNSNDSIRHISHGISIQLMSGDKLKNENWAWYFGGEWGLQFKEKSKRQEIVFNTESEHLGYTQIISRENNFVLRSHLEYNKHKLIPYFTLLAGPRVYAAGQKKYVYMPRNMDGISRDNLLRTGYLTAGGGLGLRWLLVDHVSFDLRYEQIFGTNPKMIDYDETRFSKTGYDLAYKSKIINTGHVKAGFIFDLSSAEKEEIEMYNDEITEITLWNLYAEEEYKITRALDCDCANQPIQPASLPVDTKPSTPNSPNTSEPQSTPSNPTYGGNDNDDDTSSPLLNFIFKDRSDKSESKSKSSTPKPKKQKMPDVKGPVIRH